MVAVALVLSGAAAMFAILTGGNSDENYTIRGVMPLADGTLLLVERAGMANNTYDRGRLRVIGRDGKELRRSETVKSALVVHGVAGDHVWATSHDGGLQAWRLSDLAPTAGATAAIAAHPMLSRKRSVVGVTDSAVVVRGADDKLYTITSSYQIAKHSKELPYRSIAARSTSVDLFPIAGDMPRPFSRPLGLRDTELVKPAVLLRLDGGTSDEQVAALVHSVDFAGAGSSAIVSRVEPPRIVWSVSARELVGAHDLGKNAGYRIAFAELRESSLWLIAEANVWHDPAPDTSSSRNRGYGEYAVRLAQIDPATGAIRAVHRVVQ